MESPASAPAPVRILTVCTGNICRSPVAERLLQAGLDQVMPGGFEVTSAGTRAMVGDPMQPLSGDIVRTFGGNPDGFVSRQLTSKILRGVDLVLTMTSGHRGEVLQLDASLLKRTFTIREFARMLDVLDERADSAANVPVADDGGSPLSANTAFWRGCPRAPRPSGTCRCRRIRRRTTSSTLPAQPRDLPPDGGRTGPCHRFHSAARAPERSRLNRRAAVVRYGSETTRSAL
ncbi:putative low molecular weight protein-tyrosine-phosphatase [Arthrobacter sp. Hiyo4]|nr:putative low molecular weight protein-tyrosine-phosphatase [Arthrobacter sp. Hiyo4]